MLSHVKYRNLILPESKKSKYYPGTPMLKTNCSEYNLSEKVYNARFYFILEYTHQLNMLSHVKYGNSTFMRIEISLNNI